MQIPHRWMVAVAGMLLPAVMLAQSGTSCTEITVVAWIDGSAVTLPSGASTTVLGVFPPAGIPIPILNPLNITKFLACALQVEELAHGYLGSVSNTAADEAYANAWLLKYSANQNPGATISPVSFASNQSLYRLFNDFQPGAGSANALVGATPDPCGSIFTAPGDSSSPYLGNSGTSSLGYQYYMAEGRVGTDGQTGWFTLNSRQIAWIWSVIEFDSSGNPVRYQNSANYQIFPTYSVYKNGQFLYKIAQGTPGAFAALPWGQELVPSSIQ